MPLRFRSRLRSAAGTALLLGAVLWGAVETVRSVPRGRSEPRRVAWLDRYGTLQPALATAVGASYINDPELTGKFRFFRAQYVLTPTTLTFHQSTAERWQRRPPDLPDLPWIVDFRRQRQLETFLDRIRQTTTEQGLEVTIEEYGRGLALVSAGGAR